MPYITQEQRLRHNLAIAMIVDSLISKDDNTIKGELNYIIYSIIKKVIEKKGLRYHRCNDLIGGVLTCCQMELYRRVVAPYEDKKITENGDV